MVYFKNKNPNLGILWRALERKMLVPIFYGSLVSYLTIWYNLYSLCPFGIIWYSLCPFGIIWYSLCPFGIIWYSLCPFGKHFSLFGMFGPRKIWQPWFHNGEISPNLVTPSSKHKRTFFQKSPIHTWVKTNRKRFRAANRLQ
jgi:hypothetical protein